LHWFICRIGFDGNEPAPAVEDDEEKSQGVEEEKMEDGPGD
jgi:hypothetical protein